MNQFFNTISWYFKAKYILWQQIESFNFFLSTSLKKIIHGFKMTEINKKNLFFYKFSHLNIGKTSFMDKSIEYPTTPYESRVRDLSYSAPIFLDVCYKYIEKVYSRRNLVICNMPIMLRCNKCIFYNRTESFLMKNKECPLDPGGYFIIKGTERIALIQEKICANRITVEKDNVGNICANVECFFQEKRIKNSVILKEKHFYFRSNVFLEDIPILILFKALGFNEEDNILQIIGKEFQDIVWFNANDGKTTEMKTQKQSFFYLYKRLDWKNWNYKKYIEKNDLHNLSFQDIVLKVISKNILIHIFPQKKNNFKFFYQKMIFISIMIRKIILAINQPIYLNSKDYYANKRLELSGQMVSKLFENLFKKSFYEMKNRHSILEKKSKKDKGFHLFSLFRPDIISNGLEYFFSTGNSIVYKFNRENRAMIQVLPRLSFVSSLSTLNRVNSNCEKTQKISGPRSLHSSQWGIICPTDTPEGESCGLIKNLTILAHISVHEKTKHVYKLCIELGVELYPNEKSNQKGFKNVVFLNGNCIGIHFKPSSFLFVFRKIRKKGIISHGISIFWDTMSCCIAIWTDAGRTCRPFFIVNLGKCAINNLNNQVAKWNLIYWKNLQRENLVEFLDTNEQNNAFIATKLEEMNLKTTHMEISLEIILGICSNLIPFPNHNQSPRNTYQCAMSKQTIGFTAFNQNYKSDSLVSLLIYSQKPIVKTKIIGISGNNRLTNGINACICIMSYSGYDVEDSIVLNRSSIQRGFFRSTLYKKAKFLIKNKDMKTIDLLMKRYDFLLSKKKKDINKNSTPGSYYTDQITSSFLDPIENQRKKTYDIILTSNHNNLAFIKFTIRKTRIPETGDKFSSRHGQKGICGLISLQKDLPFSNEGNIPDIIMNPHGFPSRMTIGKLIEVIGSKLSILKGIFTEGTPFEKFSLKSVQEKLIQLGHSRTCKDFFFSGISGQPLRMFVFAGSVFYQKLKHMVADKIHARSKGTKAELTRQPIEGRSKGGGLRFGEMERDCLVSYGAAELTIERMMICSDVFLATFDMKTGTMTHVVKKNKITFTKLPYACKLLFQELCSINIVPKISFESYK